MVQLTPMILQRRTGSRALAMLASLCCFLSAASSAQADEARCFAGANAGYGLLDHSFSIEEGDVQLLFDPPDDGTVFGASIGCSLGENWFVAGEYQRMDADEIELDNWLGSINYAWPTSDTGAIYLGAVAGWSTLEWQEPPVDTLNQDRESEQTALGVQLGYMHNFGERWRMNLRYMYLSLDHKTRMEPVSGRAEFEHESQQGLTLGIDWRF